MNSLEKQFNEDMKNLYLTAKKELNYKATRFWQLVSDRGGLQAAKTLIAKDNGSTGFVVLWENKRLDLSVEAHVLKPEYIELFTEEERDKCRKKLEACGYIVV